MSNLPEGSDISEEGMQNGPLSTERDPGPQVLIPAPRLGSAGGEYGAGSRVCCEGCEVYRVACGLWPVSNQAVN